MDDRAHTTPLEIQAAWQRRASVDPQTGTHKWVLDPFYIPGGDGIEEVGVSTLTLPERLDRDQHKHRLVSIRAARDIPEFGVKAGDIGGYVDLAFATRKLPEDVIADEGACWLGARAVLLCDEPSSQPVDVTRSRRPMLSGDALVEGESNESLVISKGSIGGSAMVKGDGVFIDVNAVVDGNADIRGHVEVRDDASVGGQATLSDTVTVRESAQVHGNANVEDNAHICGHAVVTDNAFVYGNTLVNGHARVEGNARVSSEHAAPIWMFARGDFQSTKDKPRGQLAATCVGGQARITDDAHVSGGVCDDNALIGERAHVYEDAVCAGNVVVAGEAQVGYGARLGGGLIEGVVRNDGYVTEGDQRVNHDQLQIYLSEGHLPPGVEVGYAMSYQEGVVPDEMRAVPEGRIAQLRDYDELDVLLSTSLDDDVSDEERRRAEETERQMIRDVLAGAAAAAHESSAEQMRVGNLICGAATRQQVGDRCQHPVTTTTRTCPAGHRTLRLPAPTPR